jgi:hypothetical protein
MGLYFPVDVTEVFPAPQQCSGPVFKPQPEERHKPGKEINIKDAGKKPARGSIPLRKPPHVLLKADWPCILVIPLLQALAFTSPAFDCPRNTDNSQPLI